MPVAPVAGEPGGVETQDSPDLSRAQPSHKPLEARPRYHPAGGAAKIVIDHLNVSKTPSARFIDELVLAPLAFEIDLNLRLSGPLCASTPPREGHQRSSSSRSPVAM